MVYDALRPLNHVDDQLHRTTILHSALSNTPLQSSRQHSVRVGRRQQVNPIPGIFEEVTFT